MNVWVRSTAKMKFLEENSVLMQNCPPPIPTGLACGRIHASEVTGRRLTTWSMARPSLLTDYMYQLCPFVTKDVWNPLNMYIYVLAGWDWGMPWILKYLLNLFWNTAYTCVINCGRPSVLETQMRIDISLTAYTSHFPWARLAYKSSTCNKQRVCQIWRACLSTLKTYPAHFWTFVCKSLIFNTIK